MYHPPTTVNYDGDAFEFIELKNVGNSARELSGVNFGGGVDFTFPIGTFISPGQFIVLVSDPVAFASKYPGVPIGGTYSKKLSNGGETVSLLHVTGTRSSRCSMILRHRGRGCGWRWIFSRSRKSEFKS
jgi:hypothetical protein